MVNFLSVLSVGLKTEDHIERFWKIKDYGATKASDKPFPIEDRRALKILEKKILPLLMGIPKLVFLTMRNSYRITAPWQKGEQRCLDGA